MLDVNIKITDRNGVTHEVAAPTDMAMNLMEIVKLYELAEEGTIGVCGGMAMCASSSPGMTALLTAPRGRIPVPTTTRPGPVLICRS